MESQKGRRLVLTKWVMFGFCALLVVPLVLILVDIFVKASPLFSWDYIWQNPVNKGKAGGLWAPLVGTFYLVIGSLLFVAPVGILAAIYLNEYAKEGWLNRTISVAVTSLAGVPSIVHALFGLGAFVLFAGLGRSILAASLTLSIMTLPVIIASTKEALSSVPQSFREACWSVGATRWQTIRGIVLPNSISGILTGVILQVSRTAGET
ncbi:MAG TPA: phosphate ABC transporter permease PstA, partial [Candidatus Dormibacteraeota bacterium]|nr:phosphate ABC transporter permease PstA [Candidatus Dormibacteraeota bacterium]